MLRPHQNSLYATNQVIATNLVFLSGTSKIAFFTPTRAFHKINASAEPGRLGGGPSCIGER